jgi:pimeloyl-ACP methyl ester carboxylesterase
MHSQVSGDRQENGPAPRVVAIGANFRPTPEILADSAMFDDMTSDGPGMAPLRDMYAAVSPDGADHWPVVLGKLTEMFAVEPALTTADLSRIAAPTLVLVGDDDMMTLEHTIDLYRAIPRSELAVIPGASHTVPLEKPALVNGIVLDFLANDPIPTMLPIRRAGA